jgi:hypothetical protein
MAAPKADEAEVGALVAAVLPPVFVAASVVGVEELPPQAARSPPRPPEMPTTAAERLRKALRERVLHSYDRRCSSISVSFVWSSRESRPATEARSLPLETRTPKGKSCSSRIV